MFDVVLCNLNKILFNFQVNEIKTPPNNKSPLNHKGNPVL